MINEENKYELIKFEDGEFSLDVNVSPSEETVWLNRNDMSSLFDRDVKTIGKHINNILKEEFKDDASVVAFFATTATDGKNYNVEYYNLEIIISVGYRVKSQRGIIFRRWATKILKQHLLNGYSISDKRCMECQENIISLNNKLNAIIENNTELNDRLTSLESTDSLLSNMLFYENSIFEAYSHIKKLLLSATKEIVIIDGYVDITVLDMLNEIVLPITIYTLPSASISNQDISKFGITHNLTVYRTSLIHDRFIIIDDDIYSIGSSIKDVGKKRFVMTRIISIGKEVLLKNL